MFKFLIFNTEDEETIFPFHLLGLKGLIGVIASFLEFNDKIGPLIDKLYAVLPAGVDIRTPSEISFFITVFFPVLINNEAACLLCLKTETSLIAIDFLINPYLFFTLISKGEIVIILALDKFFTVCFGENLFIKKP